MIKIAGIKRKKIYSPNHVINDALIFSKTVEYLNQLDVSVRIYEEDDMEKEGYDEDRASARILGRDAAKMAEKEILEFLEANLISKSDRLDSLLREMSKATEERDYEESELKVFIDALTSQS